MMDTPQSAAIHRVTGRAVPLRGDDIDTDRIMPARFLRSTSFSGLDAHLFEDEQTAGAPHPIRDPRFTGATILIVNRNFGCGSSREHAPQALHQRGIRAIVGESFSDIFLGNAILIGLACASAPAADIEAVMSLVEREPGTVVELDVDGQQLRTGTLSADVSLNPAHRHALMTGTWDSTGLLLERCDEVSAVSARLPYIAGF